MIRTWLKRIGLALFSLWILYQAGTNLYELYRLHQEEHRLEVEIARLEAKKVVLERRRQFLKSRSGIEILAQKRLGMSPPTNK